MVERHGIRLRVSGGKASLAAQAAQFPGSGARHYERGGLWYAAFKDTTVLEHETARATGETADDALQPDVSALL